MFHPRSLHLQLNDTSELQINSLTHSSQRPNGIDLHMGLSNTIKSLGSPMKTNISYSCIAANSKINTIQIYAPLVSHIKHIKSPIYDIFLIKILALKASRSCICMRVLLNSTRTSSSTDRILSPLYFLGSIAHKAPLISLYSEWRIIQLCITNIIE